MTTAELSIQVIPIKDGFHARLKAETPYGPLWVGMFSKAISESEAIKRVIEIVRQMAAWRGSRTYRNAGRPPRYLGPARYVARILTAMGATEK